MLRLIWSSKQKYTKRNISDIHKYIQERRSKDEIARRCRISKKKIKRIHYILRNGDEQILGLLFSCRYLLSSLIEHIKRKRSVSEVMEN